MRQGMAGSDAYLEQWRHGEWEPQPGSPDEVAAGSPRGSTGSTMPPG